MSLKIRRVKKNLVLTDKNLYARMNGTKWTDEASGTY